MIQTNNVNSVATKFHLKILIYISILEILKKNKIWHNATYNLIDPRIAVFNVSPTNEEGDAIPATRSGYG